jgi:hypothetical protein
MFDRTTLIAASVPVLLFLGIVVYLVYGWMRKRNY